MNLPFQQFYHSESGDEPNRVGVDTRATSALYCLPRMVLNLNGYAWLEPSQRREKMVQHLLGCRSKFVPPRAHLHPTLRVMGMTAILVIALGSLAMVDVKHDGIPFVGQVHVVSPSGLVTLPSSGQELSWLLHMEEFSRRAESTLPDMGRREGSRGKLASA